MQIALRLELLNDWLVIIRWLDFVRISHLTSQKAATSDRHQQVQ
jgi:hypothetical protein